MSESEEVCERLADELIQKRKEIAQLRAALATKDAEIAEMRRLIEDTRDLARTGLPIEGYTPEQWNDYRLIGIAGSLTTYLTYHPKEGQQ